jgi:lipoprotein signal peptidase
VPPRIRALSVSIGLALLIAAIDQYVKAWVIAAVPPGTSHVVIPGVFEITRRFNTGAAFSLFAGAGMPVLIAVNVLVVALFIWLIWPLLDRRLAVAAGACVLGGALGNMVDRCWLQGVFDYLEFHVTPTYIWPTFNIADVAIVTGVGLLMLLFLRDRRRLIAPPPEESES